MSTSDEYLANLGFDLSDLNADANKAIDILAHLGEAYAGQTKIFERGQAALSGVGKGARDAAAGLGTANKKVAEGSADWQRYVKQITAANEAYRSFRRDQITGENTGMSAGGDVSSYSTDQLREYIAIDDARTVSFIGNARKRVSAEERASSEMITAREREDRIYNEYLSQQTAAYDRAAAASIAASDRRTAQVVANYTREFEAAQRATADANAAQQSKRYATVPNASRNVATPAGLAAGADEATKQASAAMRAYYQDQEKTSAAAARMNDNLITQRYALYDVATTYGVVGAAMIAAGGYAITTGAQFEHSFTAVERTFGAGTTSASIANIRQELVELSTQIPLTFDDLSKIATLGNQLGVPEADLANFTQTVAQFATVTGMTVEATAQAFGRLSNILGLPISKAENLGSSIALVGVTSASTEAEIISLAERLGSTATRAGFTSDQVIGLAGALGSLGVAPERAQGVMETYFNSLNEAVAAGGDKLAAFARITGLTTEEVDRMVRSGQGFEVFQRFITTLNRAPDNPTLVTALQAIGLEGLRANEVIPRLASNMDLLQSSFANAAEGYGSGTELSRQFSIIVDDLVSQVQMLVSNLDALVVQLTGGMTPGLAGAVAQLNDFVTWLREVTNNPAAQHIAQIATSVTILLGVLFALRAANYLATATTYALVTAMNGLSASSVRGGIAGLVGVIAGIGPTAAAGATGVGILTGALRLLGRVVLIGFIAEALNLMIGLASGSKESAQTIAGAAGFLIDVAAGLMNAFAQVRNFISTAFDPIAKAMGSSQLELDVGRQQYLDQISDGVERTKKGLDGWVSGFHDAKDASDATTASLTDLADTSGGIEDVGGSLDDLGGSAQEAQQEVRTLVDYAGDLQSVFSRSFEIRFGGAQGMDTIQSGWNQLSKGIADAKQQAAEYQATMQSLTADKAVREYWLQVAETFGNTLRAGELRGDIAEIDAKLTKTSGDLTAAQIKASASVDGTSDAAIENRAALLGLVQNYQAYIGALASSGLSQEELTAATAAAKAEFVSQATALGFPIQQVMNYANAFDDVTIAIARVPRNITVAANTNPALQALNELEARARQVTSQGYGGINIPVSGGSLPKSTLDAAFVAWAERVSKEQGRSIAQNAAGIADVRRRWEAGMLGYESGGWTGGIARNKVAGLVHGQEYVLNATGSQMFPREMLDSANKGQSPFYAGAAKTKSTGSGMSLVEFGPTTMGMMRDMMQQEIALYVGSTEIARAVRSGNEELASQGEF